MQSCMINAEAFTGLVTVKQGVLGNDPRTGGCIWKSFKLLKKRQGMYWERETGNRLRDTESCDAP